MRFKDYSWFYFIIQKIDYKKYHNLSNIAFHSSNNHDKQPKTEIMRDAFLQLNQLLYNAYVSLYDKTKSRELSFNSYRYNTINLNTYLSIQIKVCLNYISNNFKVLKLDCIYRDNCFTIFLIYNTLSSINNLSIIDDVLIYIDSIELLENRIPLDSKDSLTFITNANLILELKKISFDVIACYTSNTIHQTSKNTLPFYAIPDSNSNLISIDKKEIDYLKNFINLSASNICQLKCELLNLFINKKKDSLNLDKVTFKIIDIAFISNTFFVIRTSYIENTRQLIFVFNLEKGYKKSYIFYILSVYPHKTIIEENYVIKNVIESSSRSNLSSKSSVITRYLENITIVYENIFVDYEVIHINFSDTIIIKDIPKTSEKDGLILTEVPQLVKENTIDTSLSKLGNNPKTLKRLFLK